VALTKVTGQVINNTTGLVVGVTTVGGGLSATNGFFSGIVTAVGDASFSGNVSVGGTLTYEDVTNIDAVGLVTARNGIVVGSGITLSKDGDIFATGVTTATTFSGSGASLTNLNASNLASGTVPSARLGSGTASSSTFLAGDSTFKTVTGTTINTNADNRVITGSDTANTLNGESGLTYSSNILDVTNAVRLPDDGTVHYGASDTAYVRGKDSTDGYLKLGTAGLERFRIGSSGQFGIGGATYGTSGQVLASQGSSSAPQWATPGLIYEGSATSFPTNTGVVDADVILDACRRIEIYYLGVSINSNSGEIIIQLRTGSGTITSGYKGSGHYLSNTSYATSSQNTSSFQSQGLGDASASYSGHVVLKNYNAHYWYCNADFWNDNAATGYWISGHVNAGAALAGVRLSNAAGSYDSGEYKIMQYNTP